jgi:hypothetical protein
VYLSAHDSSGLWIYIFPQKGQAQPPCGQIAIRANDMFVDAQQNLWVADPSEPAYPNGGVFEFAKGATKPGFSLTLPVCLSYSYVPDTVGVDDRSGTVYVGAGNPCGSPVILVYPKGSQVSTSQVQVPGASGFGAFQTDRRGDLYVSYTHTGGAGIYRFRAGLKKGKDLRISLGGADNFALTKNGDVAVCDIGTFNACGYFPNGSTTFVPSFDPKSAPHNIALTRGEETAWDVDSHGLTKWDYPGTIDEQPADVIPLTNFGSVGEIAVSPAAPVGAPYK